MSDQQYEYDAFISYRHTEPDRKWARWLHGALETYRVPSAMVKRGYPKRLKRVFRDEEELPADASLSDVILRALERSKFLIVVCSPRVTESRWVAAEIEHFRKLGRGEKILALLIDGDPTTSFPKGLTENIRTLRDAATGVETSIAEPVEPLAADVRTRPGESISLLKKLARLRLLACILGCKFDDLRRREAERLFRQRAYLSAGCIGGLLISSTAYLLSADAGLDLPGAKAVRLVLDQRDASLLRPTYSTTTILAKAQELRKRLAAHYYSRQQPSGGFMEAWSGTDVAEGASDDAWSTGQIMLGLGLVKQDITDRSDELLSCSGYFFSDRWIRESDGLPEWSDPNGQERMIEIPAWIFVAHAQAAGQLRLSSNPQWQILHERLNNVFRILDRYRSPNTPTEEPSWTMFRRQVQTDRISCYSLTLILTGLLTMKESGLDFPDHPQARDVLITRICADLMQAYDWQHSEPGWRRYLSDPTPETYDGLTFQIYAQLLRAEQAGLTALTPDLDLAIRNRLISAADRTLAYPSQTAEFELAALDPDGRKRSVKEGISFLWHPWAMEAAVRYLTRLKSHPASPEVEVRVRRTLGNLLVNLGPAAVDEALPGRLFKGAELLIALATVENLINDLQSQQPSPSVKP